MPDERAPGLSEPSYLGPPDRGWLAELLAEADLHRGAPRGEFEARVREPIFSSPVDPWKVQLATRALLALGGPARVPAPRSREIRRVVFGAATAGGSRDEALDRAAGRLALTRARIEADLFADLPSRRPLEPPLVSPETLAGEVNLMLVQRLLARSRAVRIRVDGGAGEIVRHARREGLLCAARATGLPESVDLDVSGPLALFRRTPVYARALAGLVPRLAWCRDFRVEVSIDGGGGSVRTVLVRAGDPIAPARGPVAYDRALEDRLARELAVVAPEWRLAVGPPPVAVGEALVFADFALESTGRRWLVEIAGLWTPGSIAQKVELLARVPDLVLCVDEARAAEDATAPDAPRVVRYRRRLDARHLVKAVEVLP